MSERLSDPDDLAARLGPAAQCLVTLDFDGVLAPIVDHPDAACPSPATTETVRTLAQQTAVAIISGRSLDDLRARLGELPVTWAGGHGSEILHPDGTHDHLIDLAQVTPTLDEVEESVRELVDAEPGWLVERKAASLAVHHRLADPERVDDLLPRIAGHLDARRDDGPGFEAISGKAVLELRAKGADKGGALARIADRFPGRVPLVLGDDTTDEDAFRMAQQLGGTGVLVADTPRQTNATYRLADPDAVTSFLAALAREKR